MFKRALLIDLCLHFVDVNTNLMPKIQFESFPFFIPLQEIEEIVYTDTVLSEGYFRKRICRIPDTV